jgi:hypothetical protein
MDALEWLVEAAVTFNEYDRGRPAFDERPSRAVPGEGEGDRPGDDYNRRAAWADVLEEHGWTKMGQSGAKVYWRRPGKTGRCWSATTGYCSTPLRGDLLYVFTSNAGDFEQGRAYSKFEAYAILKHGGNFSSAARQLSQDGFGSEGCALGARILPNGRRDKVPATAPDSVSVSGSLTLGGKEPETETESEGKGSPWPLPIPASQLKRRPRNEKWLWEGYVSRGGFTLFSALWKAGKTTLLAHLLHAFETDGQFCGLAIRASRVLVVSEEDEDTWAERRDDLGLKDHLEFIPRPVRGRMRAADWETFIDHLVTQCAERKFDLVVLDTISKLWPVRDENDAAQVENALLPLYRLTDTDSAVLMYHHMRKSDGAQATASRGSGALTAFVETIVEMRRFDVGSKDDTRRVLTAIGRYRETRAELVINLQPGRGYVPLGDREEVAAEEGEPRNPTEAVYKVLPITEPGVSQTDLMKTLGMAKKTLTPILNKGVQNGTIRMQGAAKKGSQLLYWRVREDSVSVSGSVPPRVQEPETETESVRAPVSMEVARENELLMALECGGEQTAEEAALRCSMDPGTAAAILSRLEADGQVERGGVGGRTTYRPLPLTPPAHPPSEEPADGH